MKKQHGFKSLRNRTIVTLTLLFFGLIVLIFIILNTILSSSINKLDNGYAQEHMERFKKAIEYDLTLLSKTAVDWANTYKFVEDENEEYSTDHLYENTFLNQKLNLMIFIDQWGEYIFAKGMDLSNEVFTSLPEGLKEHLDQNNVLGNTDWDYKLEGLLMLSEGPMLIATQPILSSGGEGPVLGNLVIGRFLDDRVVNDLASRLDLDIDVENINDINQNESQYFKLINSDLPIKFQQLSRDRIAAYSILEDIYKQPVLGLRIEIPRSTSMIGRNGMKYVLISLIAVGFVFTIILLIFLDKNILSRLLSISKEIEEGEKIQEEMRYLAYHDYLTGLPNRLLLTDRLKQAIHISKRTERIIGVIFLDLDAFKIVNDSIGHDQGDELLKEVAQRLTDTLRKADTVCRMGGDEFLIIIQNLTNVNDLERIVKKIMHIFSYPFKLKEQNFYVTASAGVAIFPEDGEDVEMLIKNADIAMYKAKEKGKNQYVFCSPVMKNQVAETMKLTNCLYRAHERNELILHYQPQISHNTGKIIGVEALIRWNHPELGLVSPGKFIPIAEQTGLINPIGEWVLRTACHQNKAWQDAGFPHIRMGVNLSVYQFQDSNIVTQVESVLKETGLSPKYLELEITESIVMKETSYIVEVLNDLKKLGVIISLDDFGTEYSSLNYLKQLPIDRIKIAIQFIHGIAVSNKDEAITKAIIILAKNLGMNVIAEGVETKQQLTFLSQRMCDEVQGFYYHKPMPASEVEALLRRDNTNKLQEVKGLS
ncbi:bifunctional diguanylate cyclase/phosphodiesterase [Natronincola ferrireducens]|uniref:Diguanylate cyclase (GGDEF) domain-containing protein n=1 Tax=Natronincola ferrireducens TaxID=393762 RepID=A0A1G9GL10_9FIRM|nr:EAL domain-containing protein [Natronincola ferrireducens]SDL01371.1 diguanylate cyclase (GGDEF) domain-containing protein [Natronincola ferrireducens]